MKVDLKKEENNVTKLDIEIEAKDAVNEYNKAIKKLSQYANIPGFRKGKAPRPIVEKHFGVDVVKQEALDSLLPNVFRQIISENKLDVIASPVVESFDFEVGKDLKLVAKVELRPEVILGDYKDMTLDVEEFENPDDAFDKALDSFLQRHASFEVVVDRKTKDSDVVVFDFDGSCNGEKIKGGAAENYTLDLAHSNFIPGFAEQLVGHSLDEDFDISVNFPEDYHEEKLAGQPAVFKIKIKEIKQKVLPELTDEFASKVGPFKNVDELKADVQKFLDVTKENENKRRASEAVFEKVLSNVKVDIQDTMINNEAKALLEEYKQRLAAQGFSYEDAIKNQGEDKIMDQLREDALKRIKNSLVIDKIAEVEDLKIKEEDLEQKFNEVEATYRMSRADLLNQLKKNPQIFTTMSQEALNQKVVEFLTANNKVEFKKAKKKSK